MELNKDEEEYAYRMHTAFVNGYDSDSNDDKSDFDEFYYANKPPPINIDEYNLLQVSPFTLVAPKRALTFFKKQCNRPKSKQSKTVITPNFKKQKQKVKECVTDEDYDYKHKKITFENYLTSLKDLGNIKKKTLKLHGSGNLRKSKSFRINQDEMYNEPRSLLQYTKSERNKNTENSILSVTNTELPLTEWPRLDVPTEPTNTTNTSKKLMCNLSANEVKKTGSKSLLLQKSLLRQNNDIIDIKHFTKSRAVAKTRTNNDHGFTKSQSNLLIECRNENNKDELITTNLQQNENENSAKVLNNSSVIIQSTPIAKNKDTLVKQSTKITNQEVINFQNATDLATSLTTKKPRETTKKKKEIVKKQFTDNHNLNKSQFLNNILHSSELPFSEEAPKKLTGTTNKITSTKSIIKPQLGTDTDENHADFKRIYILQKMTTKIESPKEKTSNLLNQREIREELKFSINLQPNSSKVQKQSIGKQFFKTSDHKNEVINLIPRDCLTSTKSRKTTEKKTNKKQNTQENSLDNNLSKSKSLNNLLHSKSTISNQKQNKIEEVKSASLYPFENPKHKNLQLSGSVKSTSSLFNNKKQDTLLESNVNTCFEKDHKN
ncbi:hypothetical protein RN001_001269 [Aquatica leii]|uniref:Uncharacterized protein n=1 Tax=Aquatica leii TaxID=1421715 RepID=A0AAN7SQU8_9COLE|nr:hypothetical protein RN001_001269 [Aquatica leii]